MNIIRNRGNEEGCSMTEVRGWQSEEREDERNGGWRPRTRVKRYGEMRKITGDRRDREDLSGKLKIGV